MVCQRFFVQSPGSQYVEVKGAPVAAPGEEEDGPVWGVTTREMDEAMGAVAENARRVVRDGRADEVNPWLKRTGWLPYLVGSPREQLIASTENSDSATEPVATVVWDAMDDLIRHCQRSAMARVGLFVRTEATRTGAKQDRLKPLQAYMDDKGMVKYGRP